MSTTKTTRAAQKCTRVADYFLLPHPTGWEKRMVEALPMGGHFMKKWIPISHGGFLTATNYMNVSDIMGCEFYCEVSVVLGIDDPCGPANFHVNLREEQDVTDASLRLWEMVHNGMAREFGCET